MGYRKIPLIVGEIYHIFTKSIAGFKIFKNKCEFNRMEESLRYYQLNGRSLKLSRFLQTGKEKQDSLKAGEELVQIIAYCFMPTHLHLILKQLKEDGISIFMNNVLNSYSRYFNTKYKRKGPLWESRFKSVLVESEEQLFHLTRYIHLNSTSASLTKKAEDWSFSSYREYLLEVKDEDKICNYENVLKIQPHDYKHFIEARLDYQKELSRIKRLVLE